MMNMDRRVRCFGIGHFSLQSLFALLRMPPTFLAIQFYSQRRIMGSVQEKNKEIVKTFYDLIINQKDFEAAKPYIGKRYRQHNPLVKDYPEGLREFIEFLRDNFPEARSEIKRVIAEDDFVVLHVHSIRNKDLERAIIEIFRLEDGKIEEHWDVIQQIPETSANPNGMF